MPRPRDAGSEKTDRDEPAHVPNRLRKASLLPGDSPIKSALTFSIIIPVYNGGKAFEASLKSVAAAVRPGDEIIVVADGESDGAWRIAPQSGATVINLEQNGGPGRARNHGAKAARGDILFFVDADVTVRPNALSLIESVFTRETGLTALIGSYDDTPYHTNFLSQYKNLLHHYVHQHSAVQATTFWGACGAIRREIFLKFGGFDEDYRRASVEDIELGYRLFAAGHAIRLEKELQVTHLKRWTTYSLIKTEILLRAAPWTRLLLKQLWRSGKMTNDLNLDTSHRLSLVNSAALVVSLAASVFNPWSLLCTVVFALIFLYLNAAMVRFFYAKRGLAFAAGAAFWRLVYDLYSWAGFFGGSSGSAQAALRRLAAFTFAKLDGVALGVATGVVVGAGLFCATGILLLKGDAGHNVGRNLGLLGQYFPGYRVSWPGAFIGLGEGFAAGYVFGWLFAAIRNFSVRIAMGQEKVRRAVSRLKDAAAPAAVPARNPPSLS